MNIFNRRVGMPCQYYVVKHILCYPFLFCFIVMKFEDKQSITMGYVYFHDCFHFSMRWSSCENLSLLSITTRQHNFWRKNFTFSQISMLICMIILTKVSSLMVLFAFSNVVYVTKATINYQLNTSYKNIFNHSTKRNTRTPMTFWCALLVTRLQ